MFCTLFSYACEIHQITKNVFLDSEWGASLKYVRKFIYFYWKRLRILNVIYVYLLLVYVIVVFVLSMYS